MDEQIPSPPSGQSTQSQSSAPKQLLTPINYLLALATILALSIAYYYAIALPAQDRAKMQLEREKFQAQQTRLAQEESDKLTRGVMLQKCMEEAETEYWLYMSLNGKKDPKTGATFAQQNVWDAAQRDKEAKLEECYKRYK
jgi:hypothetical protein